MLSVSLTTIEKTWLWVEAAAHLPLLVDDRGQWSLPSLVGRSKDVLAYLREHPEVDGDGGKTIKG
jgi:hypothetical protein